MSTFCYYICLKTCCTLACRNYVVQFILELEIPSAASKLTSQFEGNYVHLSTQKFGSHVVEKCLVVCNNETRSKIICELLSATYFEQLIQDPHANYVVQTGLRVSKVCFHLVSDKCLYENTFLFKLEFYLEALIMKHIMQIYMHTRLIYSSESLIFFDEMFLLEQGPVHNSLVDAIESHKAISRNSPYSKRIFSHKLLKK